MTIWDDGVSTPVACEAELEMHVMRPTRTDSILRMCSLRVGTGVQTPVASRCDEGREEAWGIALAKDADGAVAGAAFGARMKRDAEAVVHGAEDG
jgi:hypothetical protein